MVDLKISGRIRDKIYGDISLTEEEVNIIRTSHFQRLRWIKQLGPVHIVYPSANHTKYSHSLGVLHTATRLASELRLSKDDIINLRYAALLHDIDEVPFERIFEEYYKEHYKEKMKDIRDDIVKYICDVVNIEREKILAILNGEDGARALHQIISSDFGADRTDYLIRDSINSGVTYGLVDERIYRSFEYDKLSDEIYIKQDELGVIENYLRCYYQIINPVYDHKVVRSALSLIRKAINTALAKMNTNDPTLLIRKKTDYMKDWIIKTDSEFLNDLYKYDAVRINNYYYNKLPQDIYDINYYSLKEEFRNPKILRAFEDYRNDIEDVERILKETFGTDDEIYVDIVSVASINREDPLMVKGFRKNTALWYSSRFLKQWHDYFLELWKMYIFTDTTNKNEEDILSDKCDVLLDFLKTNTEYYLPQPNYKLDIFVNLYDYAENIIDDNVDYMTNIKNKIIELTPQSLNILRILKKNDGATADEVANETNRSRGNSNVLLRNLQKKDLVYSKRISRHVQYYLKNEVKITLNSI